MFYFWSALLRCFVTVVFIITSDVGVRHKRYSQCHIALVWQNNDIDVPQNMSAKTIIIFIVLRVSTMRFSRLRREFVPAITFYLLFFFFIGREWLPVKDREPIVEPPAPVQTKSSKFSKFSRFFKPSHICECPSIDDPSLEQKETVYERLMNLAYYIQ